MLTSVVSVSLLQLKLHVIAEIATDEDMLVMFAPWHFVLQESPWRRALDKLLGAERLCYRFIVEIILACWRVPTASYLSPPNVPLWYIHRYTCRCMQYYSICDWSETGCMATAQEYLITFHNRTGFPKKNSINCPLCSKSTLKQSIILFWNNSECSCCRCLKRQHPRSDGGVNIALYLKLKACE